MSHSRRVGADLSYTVKVRARIVDIDINARKTLTSRKPPIINTYRGKRLDALKNGYFRVREEYKDNPNLIENELNEIEFNSMFKVDTIIRLQISEYRQGKYEYELGLAYQAGGFEYPVYLKLEIFEIKGELLKSKSEIEIGYKFEGNYDSQYHNLFWLISPILLTTKETYDEYNEFREDLHKTFHNRYKNWRIGEILEFDLENPHTIDGLCISKDDCISCNLPKKLAPILSDSELDIFESIDINKEKVPKKIEIQHYLKKIWRGISHSMTVSTMLDYIQ